MIKTEHLSDSVTLHLGDCRDALPRARADAIITDPVWPNVPAGLLAGSDRPYELFAEFCQLIPESVRRLAIEMRNDSDPRFLGPIPSRFEFIQVMWCQYAMPGYLGRVLGGNKTVYVYGTPVPSAPGRRVIPSVSPKAQPGDRPPNGHPCSRALIHQEFVVNWCSDEGETILDPFMGSGTTGVAAVKLGRRFVGMEIEPKFFDLACARIADALARPDMFIKRPAPAAPPELQLDATGRP